MQKACGHSSHSTRAALVLAACALVSSCGPAQEIKRGPFQSQRIESFEVVTSLDGTKDHTWWVTQTPVDPRTFKPPAGEDEKFPPEFHAAAVPENLANTFPDLKKPHLEAWYVKTFILPEDSPPPLALLLGIINDKDRAYLNGIPVGASGRFDAAGAEAYDLRRIYEIPAHALKPGARNVLIVHVRGQSESTWGLYQYTTAIGRARTLFESEGGAAFQAMLFLACYATVALYFIFLFVWQPERRENLFFALFCLGLVAYNLLRNQFKYNLGLEFLFLKRIEYIVLYSLVPLFYWFIRSYYGVGRSLLVKIFDVLVAGAHLILAAGIVHTFLAADSDEWWRFQLVAAQQTAWPVLVPGALGIVLASAFKKSRDAWLMFTAILILVAAMVLDVFSNRGYFNLPPVFQYVFLLFIITMALLLANRFVRLHDEAEDLNANLEKKIEERTSELRTSVHEAEEIKTRQDGDYFLTSLLIQPLSGIFAPGGSVSAEVLTRQKKTFHFKKWHGDLGGDLTIVDRITLGNTPFTVFINADAMGKSMQGAGGALVAGSVFQSLLSYTKRRQDTRSPEVWLRDACLDLEAVFSAFDGSMLTSAVVGLVDEKSGVLYFFNAEHPEPVLYRDGRARFLSSPASLRKLGVGGAENDLCIEAVELACDDIVFAGTDGRDDLGRAEGGGREISSDPSVFLRCVENAPGDLASLYEEILRHGMLVDDLSLVRLGYLEDAAASMRPQIPDQAAALLSRGRAAFAARNAEGAVPLLKEAFEAGAGGEALELYLSALLHLKRNEEAARAARKAAEYPGRTRLLYLAMRAFERQGELAAALEFGTRYSLRRPAEPKGLLHLADLYRKRGEKSRARETLDALERRAPGFELAGRLRTMLGALLLFLCPFAVKAAPVDPHVLSRIESGRDFAWSFTSDSLDPRAEAEAFLKNTESDSTVRWQAARVPGELRVSSREIWLRLAVEASALPERSLAIRAGIIRDRDRVYWNGELIGASGTWDSSEPQAYDRRRLYEIPAEKVRKQNLLLIHIQSYGRAAPSVRMGPLAIGPLKESIQRDLARDYLQAIYAIVLFSIAAYFLFLYLRRSRQTDYLYFGLFALCMAVFEFLQGGLKYALHDNFTAWKRLEYLVQYASVPLYYGFLREFLPERRRPGKRALNYAAGAGTAGILAASVHILMSNNVQAWTDVRSFFVLPVCFGILALLGLYHVIVRLRAGETEAFGLLALGVLYGSGLLLQEFIVLGLLQTGSMIDFFNLGFTAASGTILSTRFMLLNREVEKLRRNLEARVRLRSDELSRALEKVRTLREAQDADYFLTTLLLGPLQRNSIQHEQVKSRMIVKQKKTFDFRKWRAEIGGDICITDTLTLAGRRCAVFINGDAMGKSLQGAGGAIVMGAVFHGALSRARKNPDIEPREWLRECYLELQNVFVSFDGSMLVSAALGLLDLESLKLLHFNAEHPNTVLYRRGKARFLGESHLMKIGVRGQEESFSVLEEQLEPGDIVIAGSDGRDDLWIGDEPDGTRIINADETLFLRIVEHARGSIDGIASHLENAGKITDDLSLVSLEITAGASQAGSSSETMR